LFCEGLLRYNNSPPAKRECPQGEGVAGEYPSPRVVRGEGVAPAKGRWVAPAEGVERRLGGEAATAALRHRSPVLLPAQ
jgi:hypothetical protein